MSSQLYRRVAHAHVFEALPDHGWSGRRGPRAGAAEVEAARRRIRCPAASSVNNRLRELRDAQGWSQAVLAERLDVSRQTVNAIETGKYDPSLPLAFRIARLFRTSIESIFDPDA